MTPARFRWGVLFILIGSLVLLQKTDVVSGNFWFSLIALFPFLLIAIGVEKIFTNTKFQVISYASSVILVIGGLYVAFSESNLGVDASYWDIKNIVQEADPAVELIDATIALVDGDLTIRDATDDLLDARFRQYTHKPKYTYKNEDGRAIIEFLNQPRQLFGGIVRVEDGEEEDDWRLKFSEAVPLILKCTGENSDIHLNLARTPLRELSLDADDADVYIKLGKEEPNVKVAISGQDTKLLLRVPKKSGLRVLGFEDSDYLYEVGLVEQDGAFVTEGYDSLSNRIEVELGNRFRSLRIDYY